MIDPVIGSEINTYGLSLPGPCQAEGAEQTLCGHGHRSVYCRSEFMSRFFIVSKNSTVMILHRFKWFQHYIDFFNQSPG